MPASLEVLGRGGRTIVPLPGARASIGKAPSNDVPLAGDRTASRLHAVLERLASGWCIKDLGSRNGTYVNGIRILGERALRPGDEIQVGGTRMVFHSETSEPDASATETTQAPPSLTPRERDVLVALCRPVLTGDLFTEPASIRQVAATLVVTDAAVKQHLARLYDKFGLLDDEERRRVRLANEAIRRGAVTLADLKAPT